MFVILDTVMFKIAESVFFLLKRAMQDLNSGQLVRVARTKKPMRPFGEWDWLAAKVTTGSRKYPAPVSIRIAGMSQMFDIDGEIAGYEVVGSLGRRRKNMKVKGMETMSQIG